MTPLIWAILLLLIGILLIVLEMFLPSGGILGVLSALSLISAVGIGFRVGMGEGVAVLLTALVATPATIYLGLKVWPHTPIGRAILNRHAMENDLLPGDVRESLIGRIGVAKSKMLPSGAVTVDGKVYNAVTSGMPIDAGQAVRIVKLDGNSMIVQPHEGPIDPSEASPEAVLEQSIESLGIDPFDDESTDNAVG